MNKAELIEKIAGDADLSKRQAGAVLDSFTDAVAKTLKKFSFSRGKAEYEDTDPCANPVKLQISN
jgi:hypothetical protein